MKRLNKIVEQDHRNVRRLTRPSLGFGGFWTARQTLAGYEAMSMLREGQVRISGNDIRAQATSIAGLFQIVASEVNWGPSQMTPDPTPDVATEPLTGGQTGKRRCKTPTRDSAQSRDP